jgi:predicted NAD-dependent protein-ADP-ribosyltransferase YbiA (DUF1768 family)
MKRQELCDAIVSLESSSQHSKESQLSDILFYNPKDPYYEFYNFYPSKFKLLDREWTCSEQYFQAMKFIVLLN